MAAVRLRWCERCGIRKPGRQHAVPMKKGVYALICANCMILVSSIFLAGPRTEWQPSKMFPALHERITAG